MIKTTRDPHKARMARTLWRVGLSFTAISELLDIRYYEGKTRALATHGPCDRCRAHAELERINIDGAWLLLCGDCLCPAYTDRAELLQEIASRAPKGLSTLARAQDHGWRKGDGFAQFCADLDAKMDQLGIDYGDFERARSRAKRKSAAATCTPGTTGAHRTHGLVTPG